MCSCVRYILADLSALLAQLAALSRPQHGVRAAAVPLRTKPGAPPRLNAVPEQPQTSNRFAAIDLSPDPATPFSSEEPGSPAADVADAADEVANASPRGTSGDHSGWERVGDASCCICIDEPAVWKLKPCCHPYPMFCDADVCLSYFDTATTCPHCREDVAERERIEGVRCCVGSAFCFVWSVTCAVFVMFGAGQDNCCTHQCIGFAEG